MRITHADLRPPAHRVMRRPAPVEFSLDTPPGEITIDDLPVVEFVCPTGAEGPERWDVPWTRDLYFTAWRGHVAWDRVKRVLYVRRDAEPPRHPLMRDWPAAPSISIAQEIVAALDKTE